MQKIYVGFLGCGNIGGGVWSLLENMRADIARRFHISFEIKKMLVRALDEKRAVDVPTELLTTDVNDILRDPEITLVCEYMGGEQPAAQFMLEALKAGKHVVTANKMALSLHWLELHNAAAQHHAGLYYEASVCGAIPVIRTIEECMTGSRIDKIGGIVNGTTNYILSQMTSGGLSYDVALSRAQELGLAEPDPTSDVEGYDAAYKLCILCALCFGVYMPPKQISRLGITDVDIIDIKLAQKLGMTMKLLARAQRNGESVDCSVSPTFVAAGNQLSHVNDAFNGVLLHGHACDDIFLYGRGAGAWPTASAIVGDMIQAAQLGEKQRGEVVCGDVLGGNAPCCRYIRISGENAALAVQTVGDALGKRYACMHTLTVEDKVYCVILTREISDDSCQAVLEKIKCLTGETPVCWPVDGAV